MRTVARAFLHLLAVASTALLCAHAALAKPVHLAWKPIPRAVRYQLSIEKDGKVVFNQFVKDTKWSGDLPFGVYSYWLRAWDKVRRPGRWTTPRALVVMADAPQAVPSESRERVFYTPKTQAVLRWKPVPSASRYLVQLKRNGIVVFTETVKGTELRLNSMSPGNYAWQVSAVIEPDGRAPASIEGRHWETRPSPPVNFVLEHQALPEPRIYEPKGEFRPPTDGRIRLRWSKVDGAEGYEVILAKLKDPGRGPASARLVAESRFVTRKTELTLRLPGEGQYVWQVRAIASISEEKDPADLGVKSVARFALDRNAIYQPGTGYVAFRYLVAPNTYQVSAPQTGGSTLSTASVAASVGLSTEYWPDRQWGWGFGVDERVFQMEGQTFSDPDLQLMRKYRVALDAGEFPWAIYPSAGLELRQYTFVLPSPSGSGLSASQNITTMGPVAGFDLRKQLTAKLSLGAKALYYLPLSGGSSMSNLSAGALAVYWLSADWAVGGGIFAEGRGISRSTSGGTDTVQTNGSYFYGSLIWSFGR